MKIAVWALIIVGIYFVYQFSVGEVFRSYQHCYDTATLELASLNPPESQMCVTRKLTYDSMTGCIANIQQSGNFASFLYQAAPVKKSIETDIEEHNKSCLSNQIEPPQQSFYISAGANR